ncbi:hypothetical protein niasHS_001808 [Heterodera schachtii]|uniref:Uncharacterized protein n=1 Tax=Heterodera schachtii TaxID=97005 RepID=A0ABD2KAL8_HETSC
MEALIIYMRSSVTDLYHFARPNVEPWLNIEATPELGIFWLFDRRHGHLCQVTYISSTENHMMKSKLASVEEGGVLRGNSVCDSPYLV